ncbi:MAG: DUF2306 domain-containing protein [Acidobacteriota bacterium]
MKRLALWTVTILALAIALYALVYVVVGERMFPPQLADSFRARPWGIYPHAFFGAVALALGTLQFRRRLLVSRPKVHRIIGTIYIAAAALTGLARLYMSFYAFGGTRTELGFGLLAVTLLTTTSVAYARIRRGDVAAHREWMIRSYALIFAAVTLRIELPILIASFGAFTPAYTLVAWSCWVPNLLWAELYIRVSRARETPIVRALRAA